MSGIKDRGFASMSGEKRKIIAGKGGKTAHALGNAHRWTREEARKAKTISGKTARRHKALYELLTPHSTRSRVLTLLQDSLAQRPDMPVSFGTLANELGMSRQYIRHLYHQLKSVFRVPPVGKKGFAANERNKRHIFTRTTSAARHRSRL